MSVDPTTLAKASVLPIAVAEGASTLVSMGAVLGLSHCESRVAPARNFVARTIVYPLMAGHSAPATVDETDPTYKKACDKATLLVKGGAMVGAGFAAHVPIQLALEGHFDMKSFKQVIVGKGAGLGVALGSILALDTMAPQAFPVIKKTICPSLAPYLPQGCDHGCAAADDTCRLMLVEVPSSIMSGLVNYAITRSLRHA